ncbi:hypothetical protein GCM10010201_34130 [Pilimelia columellifera subsp. columellifera]|uniref:Uncharacterized protein n=1 Tax=Pilimelia columellifera subsp. columellifera TaxID=706583 RepID=A0ABN3NQY8_9ACTN
MGLVWVLRGLGLEDAEKWVSLVCGVVSAACAIAGLVVAIVALRRPRLPTVAGAPASPPSTTTDPPAADSLPAGPVIHCPVSGSFIGTARDSARVIIHNGRSEGQ